MHGLDMENCYKNKNDQTFQAPDTFVFSQQKVEHVKCDFCFSKFIYFFLMISIFGVGPGE